MYAPSVSAEVTSQLKAMSSKVQNGLDLQTFLDVASKERDKFDTVYAEFVKDVQRLEMFIIRYIKVIKSTTLLLYCCFTSCTVLKLALMKSVFSLIITFRMI